MNRLQRLIVALALAVVATTIAACGGDDGRDPSEVLTAIFENENTIESGDLSLDASVSAEGEQGGSFDVSLSGPFVTDPEDPNSIPQLDWDLSVSAEGAAAEGFSGLEAGVLVTEDNLFVNYNGTDYELGEEQFTELQEQAAAGGDSEESSVSATSFREGCEEAIEAQGGDPAACDFDVTAWFTELENEGTEDVGGAETTKVTGSLNVRQMLEDLFNLGTSVPGATGGVDPSLIQGQLDTVSSAVSEATFQVNGATEDDTLRKLAFNLGIDPSAIPGGEAAGVDSAAIDFSLEIGDVGAEQTFEAPEDAQPIEDLAQEFGGSIPGLGASGVPGGGGDLGSVDPECLEQAGSDPDAIDACLQ